MRKLGLSVLIISFFSCAKQKEVPDGIIPLRPMQKVVWDVLQADELAYQRKVTDSSLNLKTVSFALYDTVFAIHKTSRETFYKSYEFYQRKPELYKKLMDGVKDIGDAKRKARQTPAT